MSSLIPVPFRNATLFLAEIDGTPYTPMKPIVEGMGLSWQGQHEKLSQNKDRWGIRVILTPSEGGKPRLMSITATIRKKCAEFFAIDAIPSSVYAKTTASCWQLLRGI